MPVDPVRFGELDGLLVLQAAHRCGDAESERQPDQVQVALAVAALMRHHHIVHQRRVDAAQRCDLVDVGNAAAELHQHLAGNMFARFVAQGLLDEVGPAL